MGWLVSFSGEISAYVVCLRVMTKTKNGINEKVGGGVTCISDSKDEKTNFKITMDT